MKLNDVKKLAIACKQAFKCEQVVKDFVVSAF